MKILLQGLLLALATLLTIYLAFYIGAKVWP